MKTVLSTMAVWGALTAAASYGQPEAKKPAEENRTGAAAYDYFKEPYRSQFVKDWENEVNRVKALIASQKAQIAGHKARAKAEAATRSREAKAKLEASERGGNSRESIARQRKGLAEAADKAARTANSSLGYKLRDLGKWETELSDLEKNDPPYLRRMPSEGNWSVGDFGVGGYVVHVLQVIDKDTFIGGTDGRDKPVMFRGFSTEGHIDDRPAMITPPIHVTGTVTYQTALGGTKTVLVAEPFDLDSLKASDEEIAARRAKRESEAARKAAEEAAQQAAIEAAKWRTWTTADGKHKVEAEFVKLILGTLTLEKKDGTTVDVKLDILCPEDKEYLEGLKQ